MQFIAQLIEAALAELFDKGVIEEPPDAMESFQAECEIEYATGDHVSIVSLCGWNVFIWLINGVLEAYHSMSMTSVPCIDCTAPTPKNELYMGRCSSCYWQRMLAAQGGNQ
jgi:hypothetical protein